MSPLLQQFDCRFGSTTERGQLAGRRPDAALDARPLALSDAVHRRLFGDAQEDSGAIPPRAADQGLTARCRAGLQSCPTLVIAPQELGKPGRQAPRHRRGALDVLEGAAGESHRPHGAGQGVRRNPIQSDPVYAGELVASDSQQHMDPRRNQRRAEERAPPGPPVVVVADDAQMTILDETAVNPAENLDADRHEPIQPCGTGSVERCGGSA
ncbi:MAG: hypothetical protein EXQ59_06170 [Acidobacteria bacterium]|nr:hypothetical protein [Acidobacteriota bacterium]